MLEKKKQLSTKQHYIVFNINYVYVKKLTNKQQILCSFIRKIKTKLIQN
jgi:hypothetical protein